MRNVNVNLLTSVAMNANRTSNAIQLNWMVGYSIQAVFTGSSINGTIKLQGSSDPASDGPQPLLTPTNWTDIANSSVTISAAGSQLWNTSDVYYNWVRFVYTDGSGGTSNGVLSVKFSGKGP